MSAEEETWQLREVAFSVLELLRFLAMHEALEPIERERLSFFRIYGGTLMISSVIFWWRYFGNRNEESHWTKFAPPSEHDEFREKLNLSLKGQPIDDMDTLWKQIEAVRNRGFAHHDFNINKRPETYPYLQPLRVTSELLYSWAYEQLSARASSDHLVNPQHIMGTRRCEIVQHWTFVCRAAREATSNLLDSPFDFRIDGVSMSELIDRIGRKD